MSNSLIDSWEIDTDWTLFLDRDGTINHRIDGYITEWDQFRFLPNALEALQIFHTIFNKILVVTNQQGIGKELMTHEQLKNIHDNMLQVVEYYDGRIDNIYYEPSLAVYNAYCRKPNPGMGEKAKEDYPHISFQKSIMIGDTLSDIEFGKNLGMKTVWIENSWEIKDREKIIELSDLRVGDLSGFAGLINRK